jgi:hypothetical protein
MGNLIGFSALRKTLTSGKYVLRIALTSNGTLGSRTLCLGGRNIAVADHGDYGYLCVFNHSAAVSATPTTTICGNRFALATSGESYCVVGASQADSTPANSIVLGTVPIATNANGDLICKDLTATIGTPDEEDVIFIGETPLRVVRKGSNWYLVVKV